MDEKVDINGDGESEDAWDFGDAEQHPVLRAGFNGGNLPLPKNSAGDEVSTNNRVHSTFTLGQNDLSLGGICVRHTRLGWERKYALKFVR